MGVYSITPAIPRVYQNSLDKSGVYGDLNLIPIRGYNMHSSHATLRLWHTLFMTSTAHGTCIKDLREMGFMGEIDLEISGRKGLKSDPVEIEDNTFKDRYCDFIEDAGFSLEDISKLAQCLFTDKKWCGNAYLHYREVTIGNVKKVYLKKLNPMHVMYLEQVKDTDPKVLLVTKRNVFDFSGYLTFGSYLKDENNYSLIKVFPDFTERGDVRETIFHFRNNDGESDYYGMPDTVQTVKAQYIDAQLDEITCQTVATEVTARKWFVLKRNAQCKLSKEEFDNLVLNVRTIATTEGKKKAKTVAFSSLPEGVEIEDFDFMINRDTDDFKAKQARAISTIYAAHGVDKEMTGLEQIKSSLGEGAMMNVFLKYDHKVVKSLQAEMANDFMKLNEVVCDAFGNSEFRKVKYKFPDKTSDLQDDIKTQEDGANNELGDEGIQQRGD